MLDFILGGYSLLAGTRVHNPCPRGRAVWSRGAVGSFQLFCDTRKLKWWLSKSTLELGQIAAAFWHQFAFTSKGPKKFTHPWYSFIFSSSETSTSSIRSQPHPNQQISFPSSTSSKSDVFRRVVPATFNIPFSNQYRKIQMPQNSGAINTYISTGFQCCIPNHPPRYRHPHKSRCIRPQCLLVLRCKRRNRVPDSAGCIDKWSYSQYGVAYGTTWSIHGIMEEFWGGWWNLEFWLMAISRRKDVFDRVAEDHVYDRPGWTLSFRGWVLWVTLFLMIEKGSQLLMPSVESLQALHVFLIRRISRSKFVNHAKLHHLHPGPIVARQVAHWAFNTEYQWHFPRPKIKHLLFPLLQICQLLKQTAVINFQYRFLDPKSSKVSDLLEYPVHWATLFINFVMASEILKILKGARSHICFLNTLFCP